MKFNYLTLNDFELRDRKVLLRLDINSPVDPSSNQILDDSRIIAAKPTLDALLQTRVVILSHQSRPGRDDFTSLEQHATLLQKICQQQVKFIDDVMGPSARTAIRELRRGEVLVLDNVRFCSEEILEEEAKKLVHTNLVKRLTPLFNLYVNDAFAAAHRSQVSLVAFPYVLPSAAGRLMEKELAALKRLLLEPERPSTYVLGGAKIEDKVPVIENILSSNRADHVLVGGNVGKIFLKAAGEKLNDDDEQWLAKNTDHVLKAIAILRKYQDRIVLPNDLGTMEGNERREVNVKRLSKAGNALDIGAQTIHHFSEIIRRSKTLVASGPMGVFEQDGFEVGTRTILEEIANSNAFTVIGGGHMAGYAGILRITGKFSHVSTAGGAMLSLLAGEELPALVALEESAKLYGKK